MGTYLEISDICTEVSDFFRCREAHPVFKRINSNTFESVGIRNGSSNMQNYFTEDSNFDDEEERRSLYWKLERDHGAQNIVQCTLSTCVSLKKKGVNFTHEGVKVANIVACNGFVNICELEEFRIRAKDPVSDQMYELPLFSTAENLKYQLTFPQSVRELLCRIVDKENYEKEFKNHKDVCDYLKVDVKSVTPHWWTCFILENNQAVHVDLCGPAYGLYQYRKSIAGNIVPIYLTSIPQGVLLNYIIGKIYPHKFALTLRSEQYEGVIIKLPGEFRPFRMADKINIEVTPTNAFLHNNKIGIKFSRGSIVDDILISHMRNTIVTSQKLLVKIKYPQNKDVNGTVLPVTKVSDNGIVTVQQNEKTNIEITLDNIVIEGVIKQIRTLNEMREIATEQQDKAIEESQTKSFAEGDIVILKNLKNKKSLNGLKALVVEDITKSVTFHDDDRFVAELMNSKKEKLSVKRMNMDLFKKADIDKVKQRLIANFLKDDPAGKDFIQKIIVTGNFGITALTEPSVLPTFEKLVKLGFGKNFLRSTTSQKQFEDMLQVSKMEGFQKFRVVIQCFRGGVTQEQFDKLMNSQPEYNIIYDKCVEYGLLKPRK